MQTLSTALAFALAALAPCLAAGDDSIQCDGGLVQAGDLKIDLLGKCGEPSLRELARTEELGTVQRLAGEGTSSVRKASPIERWTYDFGRQRFLQVVVLEAGRVRSVERGGPGYADPPIGKRGAPIPVARCEPSSIHVGDVAYEVLARCGEPATRDLRVLERTVSLPQGPAGAPGSAVLQQSVTTRVEIWAFHFGPRVFTRVVEVEDGKVKKVETGSWGYAP